MTLCVLDVFFHSVFGAIWPFYADDKIFVCRFSKKCKSKPDHVENSKTRGQNNVYLDEVAHYEPPHHDLRCLQIQLFSSLILKEF